MSKFHYIEKISKILNLKGYSGKRKNSLFYVVSINYFLKNSKVSDWKQILKDIEKIENNKKRKSIDKILSDLYSKCKND